MAILFDADFNSGSSIAGEGLKFSGNRSVSMETVDGERAAKFTLNHRNSDVSYRTEVVPTDVPSSDFTDGFFAKAGQEYWYGLRTYMPEEWRETDRADTMFTQFLGPDGSGHPPVALKTQDIGGEEHYIMVVDSGSGPRDRYDLGPIRGDVQEWVDWTWNIKWDEDDGFVKLYKDGDLVANVTGGIDLPGGSGPYLKAGLYKYEWAGSSNSGVNSRSLYMDDIRIADEGGLL